MEKGAKRIRLVAFDLDGTLLDPDLKIPKESRRAIQQVMDSGIKVVIVTGRMFKSACRYAQELGIASGPLIAYNGALIKLLESGQVLVEFTIESSLAGEVLDFARSQGLETCVFLEDEVYAESNTPKVHLYARIAGFSPVIVGDLKSFLRGRSPTKLLVIEREDLMTRVVAEFKLKFGQRLYMTTSYPFFLEMLPPHISKWEGLKVVLQREQISPEEVMAFGDSFNDIEMLQNVGFGVAVARAKDEVKAAARLIAPPGPENGIPEMLHQVLLGQIV